MKNLFLNILFSWGNICLLVMLLPLHLSAQNETEAQPICVKATTIYSKILKEDRTIFIHHPEGDAVHSNKAYPVIYITDAENHFDILSTTSRYLARWDVNAVPEMIVVGIGNTNRTRDLTPTHSIVNFLGKTDTSATSWLKPSGGNDQFFQFMREELMPYVESNYKTQPFKIFAGHSFGGITAINCMLTQPDMFSAYISISPSFWWDREYILKLADKKLKKGSSLNKILFISDGNEGLDFPIYHANLLQFDSLQRAKQLTGLEYKYIHYPEETHMTEPVKAYYDALRFIFKNWDVHLEKAELANASILINHSKQLSKRFGFTVVPNEINIDNWASYILNETDKLDNAISLFEMNTENYPGSSKAFASLAAAYVKKGDVKKAITCYQKALALNPKAPEELQAKLKVLQGSK